MTDRLVSSSSKQFRRQGREKRAAVLRLESTLIRASVAIGSISSAPIMLTKNSAKTEGRQDQPRNGHDARLANDSRRFGSAAVEAPRRKMPYVTSETASRRRPAATRAGRASRAIYAAFRAVLRSVSAEFPVIV